MYAHVVGIPLEETTLGLTPVAVLAIGGLIARRGHLLGFLRSHLPSRLGA